MEIKTTQEIHGDVNCSMQKKWVSLESLETALDSLDMSLKDLEDI